MKFLNLLICSLASALFADASNYSVQSNAAQYKGSDYTNALQVERAITLDQAFAIADSNDEIDYFVYTKGYQMVLEVPQDVKFDPAQDPLQLVSYSRFRYDAGDIDTGHCRIFQHGDAVFFKKEGMWLGSAPGLADVYVKNR